MNKKEIIKIVETDLLEMFGAKTLLPNNEKLMNLCIESTLKAINYTHCSLKLKEKEVLTFDEWFNINGYYKQKGIYYDNQNQRVDYGNIEEDYKEC